jgi:GxxExxY protein
MANEMMEPAGVYGNVLYPQESYAIQGAVFEVYREMGCGFLEAVYQECLEREFQFRSIPVQAQVSLKLRYKQTLLTQIYRADFVCYDAIIVEIKAVKEMGPEHHAQVLNYLKATGYRLGLLVNFGHHPGVQIERIIR